MTKEVHVDFARSQQQLADVAESLIARALANGASDAVVSVSESNGLSVELRQGRVKSRTREIHSGISLTAFRGQRQGSTNSTDFSADSLEEMAQAACTIASFTGEDPKAGQAEAELLCREAAELDLNHPWALDVDAAVTLARRIEAGIAAEGAEAESDGSWVGANQSQFFLATSRGFAKGFSQSNHSLAASVLARRGEQRQRNFWSSQERMASRLQAPEAVGAEAAQRALAMLDIQPLATHSGPVLFDARSACSLIGHFASAASGRALYTRNSFLSDRLEQSLFADHLDLREDPFIIGGKASAPFDGEGIAGQRRELISAGRLQGYFLGIYSARQLGMTSTGNASGPHNLRLHSRLTQAQDDFDAMLRKLDTGLLVTGLAGDGVRMITGDYSRAANGFWVQGGEIQHAVSGITIASDLRSMWRAIVAVGNDCFSQGALNSGSVLIDNMRIAGH